MTGFSSSSVKWNEKQSTSKDNAVQILGGAGSATGHPYGTPLAGQGFANNASLLISRFSGVEDKDKSKDHASQTTPAIDTPWAASKSESLDREHSRLVTGNPCGAAGMEAPQAAGKRKHSGSTETADVVRSNQSNGQKKAMRYNPTPESLAIGRCISDFHAVKAHLNSASTSIDNHIETLEMMRKVARSGTHDELNALYDAYLPYRHSMPELSSHATSAAEISESMTEF